LAFMAAGVACVSRFFQRFVFGLSVAICLALVSGYVMSEFGLLGVRAGGQQDGAYRQTNVYRDVLEKIQSDYVTEPNINDVTTGALHGLLESLDADSSYLTPAEYKIYKDRPAAGVAQVGITASKRYGYAVVVSVLPGSAADKEHLSDGDVIESIGDQSTREMSVAMIRLMLEGKPGSTLTLSVVRPAKQDPEKVMLTRSIAAVPALDQQQIEGGDADQGLRLANFFIKQGTLAVLEGQRFPRQTFTADPAKFISAAPLVVLINRGTYGPAELTAAAIEGAKRGDVVGERSFGLGSVQKTIELPDGAALLLTVAKYQSPDGKKIQDEAVTPTVPVSLASEEDEEPTAQPAKTDQPLLKAIELLKAKNG